MGINGFMKNMIQESADKKKRIYECILIDCNYLLHYFIYNCKNDNDLYYKINKYIKHLLETVIITKEVQLIFDGCHPHHLGELNPKKNTLIQRYKNKKECDDYDKQKIAPKMEIVKKFKNYINESVEQVNKIYKYGFKITINDDYKDDEADFKILDYINESDYKSYCIVSRDSDMILIAYSLIYKKKINIDILTNLKPILFVDVNELTKNNNLDYILIILLMGNDYLPKVSNIDYEIIIKNYKQYFKHTNSEIIKDDKINYDNLKFFISYIVTNKKIKFKFTKLNFNRFDIYYNNILWCLNKYKVIDNKNNYIEDTKNVINIYNFIYSFF
jgi:5'-3' exonuclease